MKLILLILLPALLILPTGCGTACGAFASRSQSVLDQFVRLQDDALKQSGADLTQTLQAMQKLKTDFETKPAPDCGDSAKLAILSAMNIALDHDLKIANNQQNAASPESQLETRLAQIAFQQAQGEIKRLK